MRVTNNMMTTNLLRNVNRNLEYMSGMQDQLATGKRISAPSDDPVLASKILARKTDLAELEQYDKNTRDALGWMEITEKAIEDNGELLQRVRELTVQAANSVNTAEDTQKVALEIENLKKQLISNGNATFAGRYIFSGFETDKKLLNEDGSFNIDIDQYSLDNTPVVQYEVSVGESMDVMTSGLDIYGTVTETNVMTTAFSSLTNNPALEVASSKERVEGDFDLTANYAGQSANFTINGTAVSVDLNAFNGSIHEIDKGALADQFNAALGLDGSAYFNSNDKLVIESAAYGPAADITVVGIAMTNINNVDGTNKGQVQLTGTAPFTVATAADREVLLNNNLNIVINGISKKLKPDMTSLPLLDPATFTEAEYISNMQGVADNAFGANLVDLSIVAGQFHVETVVANTADASVPTLSVDFPRVHENQLIADIDELLGYLNSGDNTAIGSMLTKVDGHMSRMLALRADIGARNNRLEMVSKKIASSNISFTKMLSDAEDADMAEVIMLLKNAENVYQASLSTGARVIQPSLVDFLR